MVVRLLIALLFVAWVGEWPLAIDSVMYSGLWRSPFVVFGPLFEPVPGIRLFTWQLLLIALTPVCLAVPGAFQDRSREMDAAIFVSLGAVAITFFWGWLRGGGAYEAYYQLWRFLAALLIAYLLMSVLRTPRDLQILAKAIIAAALIRGTLVIYFYWVHVHGKIIPRPEYMTNHDDSLLFVAAILIVVGWAILNGGRGAWKAAIAITLYLFYAMVLNDRRIAWVELALGMVAIYFLMGAGPMRRRVTRWALLLAPLALVVLAVLGGDQLERLLMTGSYEDPSSLGRQEEVRNLLYTMSVKGNPLFGTGWGVPYVRLTNLYNNYPPEWVMAFYTPHNSLLGLAAFAGLVGIVGIWGVVPIGAYLAARGYRSLAEPIPRTAAMVALGMLVAYSVHCYGDIGLQSFPGGLLFGAALATAGKVASWGALAAAKERSPIDVDKSRAAPFETPRPRLLPGMPKDGSQPLGHLRKAGPENVAARSAQRARLRLKP